MLASTKGVVCDSAPMTTRLPNPAPQRISQTAENYLLSLAILQEDGLSPHISELAAYPRRIPEGEEIGTILASVSGMIQRVVKDGLLKVTKGKRITLTGAGQARARDVVRRHRLAERLLVDVLNVPLQQGESEAHSLEHGISPTLLERIEENLGYPDTCPYGRPIYRAKDTKLRSSDPDMLRLSEAKKGSAYVVMHIPDEDVPLLSYLVESEVLPGQRIIVEDMAGYRGVVDISRNGAKISLGMDVAACIRVKPA